MSWPPTVIRPEVGGMKPVIMRMVVDLPAPLGPRKPSTSPRSTVNETSFTASFGAERLRQVFDLDHASPPAALRLRGRRFSSATLTMSGAGFQGRRTPALALFDRTIPKVPAAVASAVVYPHPSHRQKARLTQACRAGADSLNRTDDLPLTRRLLYH